MDSSTQLGMAFYQRYGKNIEHSYGFFFLVAKVIQQNKISIHCNRDGMFSELLFVMVQPVILFVTVCRIRAFIIAKQ